MEIMSAILWMLGIAVGLTGICYFYIRWSKKRESNRFDERQRIARGEGYAVSFWVGAIYYLCVMLSLLKLDDGGEVPVSPFLLVYFGFLIQTSTLHIHGLLTHSVLPLGEKPVPTIIGYFFCALANFFGFWVNYKRYPGLDMKGHGVMVWLSLANGVMFFLLALAHLISLFWREREEAS